VPSKKQPRAYKPSDRKARQTRVARDAAEGASVSSIPVGWQQFREFYDDGVISAVEALFAASSLNIQLVMMVQAADCLRVRKVLKAMDLDDLRYMQLERLASAQIRHLRLMAERFGPNATADGQLVAVPDGLILPSLDDPTLAGDDSIIN